MGIPGALISGGGPLLGGIESMFGANSANRTAINLANTQYQRSVEDMKKAGLNPMMMLAKGGGPAPTPSIQNIGEGLGEGTSAAGRAIAIDAPVAAAGIAKTQADTAVAHGQIAVQDAQKKQALSQAAVNAANAANIAKLTEKIPHDISLTDALAGKAGQEAKLAAQNILTSAASAKELGTRQQLEAAQIPVKTAEASAASALQPLIQKGAQGIQSLFDTSWRDYDPFEKAKMQYSQVKGEIKGTLHHWAKGIGNVFGGNASAQQAADPVNSFVSK
jgi:hypothetical protein